MKKRWIPFIISCVIVSFLIGQFSGANSQAEHEEIRAQAQAITQTTIAVINADTGAIIDGERQNFSAAIIDTLGDDFVLVSPAMAHTGYTAGLYGAIVTFPSNTSERILSFNANNPEQVRLEFQVNPNLPEHDFIETYSRIMDLQMSINTTLAYTYVSSIFYQFHAAQDQIGGVFQNDMTLLEALGIVNMERFTTSLQLDELPYNPLNPNAPITSHFLVSVTDFAQNVSHMYLNSFQAATRDYLEMRRDLIALTDNFPYQENEWMEALADWSGISVQFGQDLQEYSSIVRQHQRDLENWHQRAAYWNENLINHEEDLTQWHTRVSEWNQYLFDHQQDTLQWHDIAVLWNENLIDFQEALSSWRLDAVGWNEQLLEYNQSMTGWRTEAISWHEDMTEHREDISSWRETLFTWNKDAKDWLAENEAYLDSLEDFGIRVYNYLSEIIKDYNKAIGDLEDWLDSQKAIIEGLNSFARYHTTQYNNYITTANKVRDYLMDWQQDLEMHALDLHTIAGGLYLAIDNMAPFPSDDIYPGMDLDDKAQLLEAWYISVQGIFAIIEQSLDDLDYLETPLYTEIPDLNPFNLPTLIETITLPPTFNNPTNIQDFTPPDTEFPDPKDPPPDFEGMELPDIIVTPPELDTEQPGEPPPYDIQQPDNPPQFTGEQPETTKRPIFEQPGNPLALEIYQPEDPLIAPPPRPDDFWASLNYLQNQLLSFDIDNYLTEAYRLEIERLLRGYEQYLDIIRTDLASQFEQNVNMLQDVRFGYTNFLSRLRIEAMQAESEAFEHLNNTLNAFTQRVGDVSLDTRNRLDNFALMMPESRTPIGPNRDLVRFTVAPLEFVAPQMRDVVATPMQTDSVSDAYQARLWIALPILGVMFVGTLVSYGVRGKRKEEVE